MSQSVIFISYRHKDSYDLTDRLANDLIADFEKDVVFQDKERIKGGDDWSTEIESQARSCSIMLVVIGSEWKKATYDYKTPEKEGLLRLYDPEDWIRKEITLALENGRTVIPLLVNGAELPNKKWLQGCGLERLFVPQTMSLRSKDYKNDLQVIKTTLKENPALSGKLIDHPLTKEIESAKEKYTKQLVSFFSEDDLAGISIDEDPIEEPIRLREIFTVPDLERKVTSKLTIPANSISASRKDGETEQSESLRIPATYLLKDGDNKRVLLQGDAGSGKTFLLKYFLLRLCGHIPDDPAESISHWLVSGKSVDYKIPDDINRLPILIRIRDLVRYPDDMGIVQFLEEFAENELACNALPKGFFEYWLRKKQAFIFVDGLDEAPTAKKSKIVRQIKAFIENYTQSPTNQNRIVITSRSAGNPGKYFSEDDFSRYWICPFNTRQIRELSSNWYDNHIADEVEAKHKKKTLQKALSNNERLKDLAKTPLLLTIILLIHSELDDLPKERHELYHHAIETLLRSWEDAKMSAELSRVSHIEPSQFIELMYEIAYYMHSCSESIESKNGLFISKKELIEKISEYLQKENGLRPHQSREEAKCFIEDVVRDRAGLLSHQGNKKYYSFVHRTFQEYLTAEYLRNRVRSQNRISEIFDEIQPHLHESRWREVILLLSARLSKEKARELVQLIFENGSSYENWLHRDLILAGYCLAENPNNFCVSENFQLSQRIFKDLLKLESENNAANDSKVVRDYSRDVLLKLGGTGLTPCVLDCLNHFSGEINQDRELLYRTVLEKDRRLIAKILPLLKQDKQRKLALSLLERLSKYNNTNDFLIQELELDFNSTDSQGGIGAAMVLRQGYFIFGEVS